MSKHTTIEMTTFPATTSPSPSPPSPSLPLLAHQSSSSPSLPSPPSAPPSLPENQSKLYVIWERYPKVIVGGVMVFSFALVCYQVYQLFKIKDFYKRPTDYSQPAFIVLGLFTNWLAAVGFGRPVTPFYISIGGLFVSLCFSFVWKALWEWFERFLVIITPLALGFQFFWNGCRHGRTAQ